MGFTAGLPITETARITVADIMFTSGKLRSEISDPIAKIPLEGGNQLVAGEVLRALPERLCNRGPNSSAILVFRSIRRSIVDGCQIFP
jgi:hypothetical protein